MLDSIAENADQKAISDTEPNKFDQMVEQIQASKQPKVEESEEVETPKEEAQKVSGETKMDWEKAYKNVQAEKDKFLATAEKAARIAIEKDPTYIHDLAEMDKSLADRIIKAELGKEGITNYDQLVSFMKKQEQTDGLDEPSKAVYEKVVKPLEEKLTVLEQKQMEKEKAEADLFIARFKEERPDFDGDLEKECWEFFEKSGLPLEEVYDFLKFKKGSAEDATKAEERAYKKIAQSKVAGSLTTSGSKATPKATKNYSPAEMEFLAAMGKK